MLKTFFLIFILIVIAGCKQETKIAVNTDPNPKIVADNLPLSIDSIYIKAVASEFSEVSFYFDELNNAYIENGHKPLWYDQKKSKPHVALLFNNIDTAAIEGFDTIPFAISKLKLYTTIPDSLINEKELYKHDLLLSNLLLHLAQFKQNGILASNTSLDYWNIPRTERPLIGILKKVLETKPEESPFSILELKNNQYLALRDHLFYLKKKEQEGGWPQVDSIGKIKIGDTSAAVPSLRKRLVTTGEYFASDLDSEIFDTTLFIAVKKFQKLHGLNDDGVPGGKTLLALNKTVWEKIEQVKVNMERWKWLPKQFEDEHVLVNVPGFTSYAYRNNEKKLEMRVITGTARTLTPVFLDTIEYIVASPYWNIPFSIATNEILPQLKKNPGYIDAKSMEVLAAGTVVNHYAIDWGNVSKATFRYQIRQKPGDFNSLGRIKFMFPNQYNIYMHDTNAKNLFNKDERTLSHGCIRISKPVEFAQYLLHDKAEWTIDSITVAMQLEKEQIIRISKKVPVYMLYFTAWADDEGNVQMYKDVYWRDQPVQELNSIRSVSDNSVFAVPSDV